MTSNDPNLKVDVIFSDSNQYGLLRVFNRVTLEVYYMYSVDRGLTWSNFKDKEIPDWVPKWFIKGGYKTDVSFNIHDFIERAKEGLYTESELQELEQAKKIVRDPHNKRHCLIHEPVIRNGKEEVVIYEFTLGEPPAKWGDILI